MGLKQIITGRICKAAAPAIPLAACLALLGGCETQSFFDPSEMGRYKKKALVVPILKNLDTGIDEPNEQFASASDVRPGDLVASVKDSAIGPNDLLQVSITDLVQQGQETPKTTRVTESGTISLPLLSQPVKASGRTEAQLEGDIAQAYKDANQLPNAQVSVVMVESRNRSFSMLGAVTQPGSYLILDNDFRLLDALVLAKDVTSPTGVDYVYIVRQRSQDMNDDSSSASQGSPTTQPTPDMLAPHSQADNVFQPKLMLDDAAPTTQASGSAEGRIIVVDDKPMQIEGGKNVPAQGAQSVTPTAESMPMGEATTLPASNFQFNDLKEPTNVRVIKVPLDELRKGDLRYNVVIRPQDMIIVPQPSVGEYYVGGHVARTGVYSLTARNITIKQAIIAAGMLDQVAIPARTQIVRRIGPNKEVFARVNLEKIFNGEEPDLILKPDDQVMVGTNGIAPFLAAFRSGFRVTYGFGFLYDRNFYKGNNNGGL